MFEWLRRWKRNRKAIRVAAHDSSWWAKRRARYVCDGWYDEREINQAAREGRPKLMKEQHEKSNDSR